MQGKTIALAGQPNCGKTTLFNRLTGSAQHVGNWPGVTVERREGLCGDCRVIDLPGTYALNACSEEERITADFLRNGCYDVLVCVMDAVCLSRSLYLTVAAASMGKPMVAALNMMDEVRRRGDRIDTARLAAYLGMPVVPICARTGEGIDALLEACAHASTPAGVPSFSGDRAIEDRYAWIDQLLLRCCRSAPAKDTLSDRLDRLMMHPALGCGLLACIFAGLLWLVFGPVCTALTDLAEALLAGSGRGVAQVLRKAGTAPWLASLVTEGILPGVSAVLSFAPMILLVYLALSLLEDSGCMARAAFLLDRPMRAVGLNGKSVFPLLLGFGCTVPSVMAARSVAGEAERRRTAMLAPFIPCSAKGPVFAMIAAGCFPGYEAPAVFCLQAGCLLLAAAVGLVANRGADQSGGLMLMELPPWRMPDPRHALRSGFRQLTGFLRRVLSVILLASVCVWFLRTFTAACRPVEHFHESMLGAVSGFIAPLLAPLGFGSREAAAALLMGLIAKENILGTLAVLSPEGIAGMLPSPAAGAAFLAFAALYAPCVAAMSTLRKETGLRTAAWIFLRQTALAWCIAYILHGVCGLFAGFA